MVLLSIFWAFGAMFTGGLAWIIIPRFSCEFSIIENHCSTRENMGWRYLVGVLAISNFLMFLLRFGFPESPIFLAKKGRLEEAEKVIRQMAKMNGTTLPDFQLIPEESNSADDYTTSLIQEDGSKVSNFKILLSKKLLRTTILLWTIWFTTSFGYTGFNIFLPDLLEKRGLDVSSTYRDALIYAAAGIPGSFAGAYFVETRLGRKWTMAIFTLISGLFMFLFTLARSTIVLISFTSLVNVFAQIMYAAIYTYTPEVFPTAVRTSGVGTAAMFAKASGIIAPSFAGWLLSINLNLPLFVSFGFMAVGSICACLLPIETRGRTLE